MPSKKQANYEIEIEYEIEYEYKSKEEQLTVLQIAKLAEWLQMHGHSAEEVLECIRYLAGKADNKEKESAAQPTKRNG